LSSSDFYSFCLNLIIVEVTLKQYNTFPYSKTSCKNKVYESMPVKHDSSKSRNSAYSNDRNKTHIRSFEPYLFPLISWSIAEKSTKISREYTMRK
jgi:hypothetical protein